MAPLAHRTQLKGMQGPAQISQLLCTCQSYLMAMMMSVISFFLKLIILLLCAGVCLGCHGAQLHRLAHSVLAGGTVLPRHRHGCVMSRQQVNSVTNVTIALHWHLGWVHHGQLCYGLANSLQPHQQYCPLCSSTLHLSLSLPTQSEL